MARKPQTTDTFVRRHVGKIVTLALIGVFCICAAELMVTHGTFDRSAPVTASTQAPAVATAVVVAPPVPVIPPLDTVMYDQMIASDANGDTSGLWPVKTAYPLPGAILPFSRIVAYYGNFYSTSMGVLGQYPAPEMLSRLQAAAQSWRDADPSTPVIPAIHYIAVTAQGQPGFDGKYRSRMPPSEIDKAVALANDINGLTFLDIQPAQSTVQEEVPLLDHYLEMPTVHLGIDPEFYMHNGKKPGTVIGTIDASDINFVTAHLAQLVDENHLPPKILIIHRFTQGMVTNYKDIVIRPEVQIVMDFDGWGHQANKISAYQDFIEDEPVEFTGFKLFYKNDVRDGSTMLTPSQVLALTPKPLYIQYQ